MTGPTYINDSLLNISVEAKKETLFKRLKSFYPCVEDVKELPQSWSTVAKAPSLGLTWDGLGCYFRASVSSRRDEDAASIITDNHIPRSCLLYYFEITFVSKGRDGCVGIGLASVKNNSEPELTKLPGWTKGSYGYHSDDGNVFIGDGRCHRYEPIFTTGDVIGCGINLVENKCFFTRNGLNLGLAAEDMSNDPDVVYYPTVGLKTPGEEILANFGQQEFVYDIEEDLRAIRKTLTSNISNYPIPNFFDWQSTLHKLVQSWLITNSYPQAAQAFSKSTKLELKENTNILRQRYKIQQLVLKGRISEAIRLTNRLYPNLLDNEPNLLFVLRCRQFIELISGVETDFQMSALQPETTTTDEWSSRIQKSPVKSEIINGNDASKIPRNQLERNSSQTQGDVMMIANNEGHTCQQESPLDENTKLAKLLNFAHALSDQYHRLEKLYGKNELNERMLSDAISLIAFTDPKHTCFSKLLKSQEREPVSRMLNDSIVKAEMGDQYRLPLEDVMNHLNRVIRLNNSHGRWLLDKLY